MKMITIYHNPRCKKSRAGLQYLQEKEIPHMVMEYLKTPLSKEIIARLLLKLNKKPNEIIRTQEEIYRKELKGKSFTDEEWIKIIIENPKLLQRPLVESKYRAVVADPPEKIDELDL